MSLCGSKLHLDWHLLFIAGTVKLRQGEDIWIIQFQFPMTYATRLSSWQNLKGYRLMNWSVKRWSKRCRRHVDQIRYLAIQPYFAVMPQLMALQITTITYMETLLDFHRHRRVHRKVP